MAKKKRYSVNLENGKVVSVEVDGVKYAKAEDIPDEDDRDKIEFMVFGMEDDDEDDDDDTLRPSLGMPKIILWVFLTVTLLMLTITVISAFVTAQAMAREVSVPGRVLDLMSAPGEDGSSYYRPLVEYTVDNERTVTVMGDLSRPPAYRVAQPVTVRYDPSDPERTARISSFGNDLGQFTVALICGFLAAAFAGASYLAHWLSKQ